MATFGGGFFHAFANNHLIGTSTDRMRAEHEGDRGQASTTLGQLPPWLDGQGSSTRPWLHGSSTDPRRHGNGADGRAENGNGTSTRRRAGQEMLRGPGQRMGTTTPSVRVGFAAGTIASLRADGLTITQPDGTPRIVSVRGLTQIRLRGADSSEPTSATLADLKVGDHVVVRGLTTLSGSIIAEMIQDGMPMPMGRPEGGQQGHPMMPRGMQVQDGQGQDHQQVQGN